MIKYTKDTTLADYDVYWTHVTKPGGKYYPLWQSVCSVCSGVIYKDSLLSCHACKTHIHYDCIGRKTFLLNAPGTHGLGFNGCVACSTYE